MLKLNPLPLGAQVKAANDEKGWVGTVAYYSQDGQLCYIDYGQGRKPRFKAIPAVLVRRYAHQPDVLDVPVSEEGRTEVRE